MQAVIIAAGESTRFWPFNKDMHKSQIKIFGKSLLYWTIKGLAESGIKEACVVVSKESSIPDMLAAEKDVDIDISFVVQEKPLGTGNALWQAKDFVKESFVLLWGSKVRSKELVAQMLAKQKEEAADAVLVGTEVENPEEYGVLRMEDTSILEIVENPKKGTEPSNIAVEGVRLLTPDFFDYYEGLAKHHEADLVDATNKYVKEKKVSLLLVDSKGMTLKYPWHLFHILDILFASSYFKAGKGENVHIGEGAVIENEDQVYIGNNTRINAGAVIQGPAYIGDNCIIGYNNVLRGPINIEANVQSGAFMELKHDIIQEKVIFHAGYAGDSIIGKNSRFGAGFVTANRRLDGKAMHGFHKLGACIGEGSSFGIHSGTMPSIRVGSDCKVGPATLLFQDLPDNTVSYVKQKAHSK